jgi:alkaline phosphatase D
MKSSGERFGSGPVHESFSPDGDARAAREALAEVVGPGGSPGGRRDFLGNAASVSALALLGTTLAGCADNDPPVEFRFGVASGDPLEDRVVLWTHAKYQGSEAAVPLTYEVASDDAFRSVVSSGSVTASPETGFTAKVDAPGLAPGRKYFYRFRGGNEFSRVGQTRTLPDSNTTQVKLAVLSCSYLPFGYFHVYAEVAKSDAEYAVHLGDYIYEFGKEGGGLPELAGRGPEPATELLSLDDYRKRYAQYRLDPDSQEMHARLPMFAVWDDHESANDAWREGAQNHDPAKEGTWTARKAAAVAAWHEWMPVRSASDKGQIDRSFNFGRVLSLHMLDTRLAGRDEQISFNDLAGADAAKRNAALAAYANPNRQLLGAAQFGRVTARMAQSPAVWQVLGSQVLMARIEFPVSVLSALNPSDTSPAAQAAGTQRVNDFLLAKATPAALRSPAQSALMDETLNPRLGYNLDAWDGYIAARETLLGAALQLGKPLVVLAGDTHNAWHSNLTLKGLANPAMKGMKVGEEFATPSVTSPGLEGYLTLAPAELKAIFEGADGKRGAVDDLKWMNSSQRGFLKMTFSTAPRPEAKGEWIFVSTVADRNYRIDAASGRTASFSPA